MKYILRAAVMDDALRIAPLLRDKDKREIEATTGLNPVVSLGFIFLGKGTRVIAETPAGDPIMIAGIQPTHPKAGAIWMMGTPLLEHYALPSIRASRKWIEQQHETYPLLWNHAWQDNDLHVRWLKMLGFKFIRRLDKRGHTFIEFARIR